MFQWTPDMVRFMRDASELGDYHRELADHICPLLSPEESLCDAGCGLGYLSLALSPRCRRVTAVDIAAPALAVLRENLAHTGISNVRVHCGDMGALPSGENFDTMVFCLFGGMEETLRLAAGRCRKQVVLVKRNHPEHRFTCSGAGREHRTLSGALAFLEARGIPCQQESLVLRMDQPFRSLEDAALFFRIYSRNPVDGFLTPHDLMPLLTPCEFPGFPWVLPVERSLGILTLPAAALPRQNIT